MDLSAIDVQQKTFRERFRGYDPDDVEDFLDRIVETLRGHELKLRQQQESLDAAQQDLAGSKEAEEAIKRTYITAQRTAQEMVTEAQEKANRLMDNAKAESESMLKNTRSDLERQQQEAATEHDALLRRVAQLRTAVSELQGRLQAFAEGAAVELEGLGASIDLETHSVSEILGAAAVKQDRQLVDGEPEKEAEPDAAPAEQAVPSDEAGERQQVSTEPQPAPTEAQNQKQEQGRDAAYLQQPRGQRPWERA